VNVSLDFEATIFDDIDIDSYAAYVQGTYDLTDKLSMTAGARYTDEDKTFTTKLTRNASGVTTVPETTVDNSWDAFTPRLGFEYQWADNVMAYVSAAKGFKSGGFNGRSQTLVEIESFDPENLWAYEVGIKSQWADNTVMLNLAAFYNDYTDIQLTSVHAVEGIIVAVTRTRARRGSRASSSSSRRNPSMPS
jgi:iron complex outermembrane receptor protein